MCIVVRPDRIDRKLGSRRETIRQFDLPNTENNFESLVNYSRHELLHSVTVANGVNTDDLARSTDYIEILLEIICILAISILTRL